MAEGTITRKRIIEDEALKWGSNYAENTEKAIEVNIRFVKSLLEIKDANDKMRSSATPKEYIENQKKVNEIAAKSSVIWKEQLQLENALISTKKKNALATEGTARALAKERIELMATNKQVKQETLERLGLVSAYTKLSNARTEAKNKLRDLMSTEGASIIQIKRAQIEFEKLNSKVLLADKAVGDFSKNVGNYPQIGKMADQVKSLFAAFGLVGGLQAFASITKEAFKIVVDFEAEIVNLAAISGKSREEIAPLELKIREVAKASINGATDVAKLATELIKLGSTPEEAAKLLKPVNDLSIALRASAEDAATLVKSLLNSFQQGADQAGKFTDVLAAGANRSALDFEGLKDALAFVAPSANALGIPLEKTVAIVGTLADNGIKASSAGRLLSTSFITLAKQGKTLEEALSDINRAQAEGKSRLDVLSIAGTLFGAESAKIGLVLANNTEKIKASTEAYENSKGSLEELTNKQLKSVSAELKILDSEWEDYIIGTNDANGGTQAITTTLRFLSGNLKTLINLTITCVGVWLAYRAALALANVQARITALTMTATTAAQQKNVVVTGFGTAAQLENAAATTVATGAWQRFTLALKENLLGLIVASLIAVIYYYEKWTDALENNVKNTKASTEVFIKNREVISKNGAAINTLSDRYDVLKNKSKLTTDEQKELNKIIEILSKNIPGAVTEIDKYGDATAINTVKTREFVKAQKELNELQNSKKLRENKEALEELRKERDRLNVSSDKSKGTAIDEIGYIVKVDGVLKRRNGTFGGWVKLSEDEQIIFKQRVLDNEKNIGIVERNIKILSGQTQAEKEVAKAADEAAKSKQESGKRTIEIIDAEIKALEDSIELLSDKTGKDGDALKKKIAALKAERELIYSTAKAERERGDNGLKNARKVYDAIYQLSQFRLQNAIDINQRIIDSDKSTTDQQLEALHEISQLRQTKNEETLQYELQRNALEKVDLDKLSKEKFALYKKDADSRISQLISGKIALDKMTSEERLIFEKYYAEIDKLREDDATKQQALVDSEVAKVQKRIDTELQKKNIELNEALDAENKKFLAVNDLEKMSQKEREDAVKEHERRVLEIKKDAAKKALQIQIDDLQSLLDTNASKEGSERLSAKEILDIQDKIAEYRARLGDIDVETNATNIATKTEAEKKFAADVEQLSKDLKDSLVGLANAIFDRRISNIDYEMQKSNEYYDNEIKLAGNDERKKDLLQKEQERKNNAFEKRKQQVQHKQAVFNKALSIASATAKGVEAVLAALAVGPPQGIVLAALAGAVAAAEIATIIATPIPKYKTGRKGGKEEIAIVGDGYVSEVISRPDGSNPIITPSNPSFAHLQEDDVVHKSISDYNQYMRDSILNSVSNDHQRVTTFNKIQASEANYSKEMLDEMRLTRKAIERNKANTTIINKVDIAHELWKFKNTNWHT